MSSTSFGQWYEDQKADESGSAASSSWLGEQTLPLFEGSQQMAQASFGNFKAALENQMPKQILGMGYQQRFKVFCALLFLSALFFALAFFVGVPVIVTMPRKFALSFTMGSLTFMMSFGILKGPYEHLMSMLTRERLPFTTVYLGSMAMTLYFTFTRGGLTGYVTVMVSAGVQLLALLWYLVSFLPGGSQGLKIVLAGMIKILQPVLKACAKLQARCVAYIVSRWTNSS